MYKCIMPLSKCNVLERKKDRGPSVICRNSQCFIEVLTNYPVLVYERFMDGEFGMHKIERTRRVNKAIKHLQLEPSL